MRHSVLANTAALIGGLFLLAPAAASAQAAAAECTVNQDKPKELALASFSLTRVTSAPAGPARDPMLKQLFKDLLDKPEKFKDNVGGYQFTLTQVLSLQAGQPDGLTPKTRAAIGTANRPNDPFDVIAELDSAFQRWEAAMPVCAKMVADSRNGEAWVAVTNKAFGFIEKGPADSAIYFAQKSAKIAPLNPFAHHILAQVASTKNDMKTAVSEWKEVVKLSGADTNFKDIKNNALFYIGTSELSEAAKATGDAQKAQAKSAAGYFKQYLDANPNSPDAPNVLNNMSEALKLADDIDALKAMYADMIANPSKYSETSLASGGVIASLQVKDDEAALKLFQGVITVNPYSRDGLRNVASMLYTTKRYAEVAPIARRLVEIDPNNYDGWMYFAFAAAELEKPLKAGPEKKAWGDTLIKYNNIADSLKVRVEVSRFTRGAEGADVTLDLDHQGAAPATYSITVEFLDKDGKVVGTATESSGEVKKGEKKSVSFKSTSKDIAAFRYQPIK
jgi:tetratricopeptide (TPR) repeat protein